MHFFKLCHSCRKKERHAYFFVRMRGYFSISDTIEILCQVHSNLWANKIIFKARKRSVMGFKYFTICTKILINYAENINRSYPNSIKINTFY